MKANAWRGMVATVLGAAGIAVAAGAPEVEYSADSYMETAEAASQGTVHVARGMERREFVQDGQRMVSILRRDRKVIWMLMPEDQIYMEMKMPEGGRADDLGSWQQQLTRMGPETVNGVPATKNKVIMSGPGGAKLGGFSWVTREGIVVKLDAISIDRGRKDRLKTELKSLKIGKQDPALFEIPPGYTRMDMGMPGMGQMMGGPAAPRSADAPKEPKRRGFGFKDALDLLK